MIDSDHSFWSCCKSRWFLAALLGDSFILFYRFVYCILLLDKNQHLLLL